MTIANYDKTSLLLPLNGSNNGTTFTDFSYKNHTISAVANAKTSTTESKYYGSSGYFDGTGDYLSAPTSADFIFGTGDFAIQFWIKTSDNNFAVVDFFTTGQAGWEVFVTSSGYLNWYTNTSIKTGSVAINDNAWHHILVQRASGSLTFWVDGVQDGTGTTHTQNLSYATNLLCVGAQVSTRNATYDFSGYINDLQIVKGATLQSSTFTPPEKLIGTISGTIKDDTNANAIRTITAVPRSNPSRTFHTTSAADGTYSLTVPDVEHSVIVLDDDAGTLYNDIIMRVLPG